MTASKLEQAAPLEVSPLESAQKVLEGCTELTSWAMSEVRNGWVLVRHPGVTLGGAVWRRVKGVLHAFRARAEADALCEACGEARAQNGLGKQSAKQRRQQKHEDAPAHPDQTTVHLGPHHVEHRPFEGGIHVHPSPVVAPVGVKHPRGASRHN